MLFDAQVNFTNLDIVDRETLWQEITKIAMVGNVYQSDLIALNHWKPLLPETNQWVVYSDEQSSSIFSLNGGRDISSAGAKMSATLNVSNNNNSTKIMFDSDQVVVNGNDVKVTFPSLNAMGISNQPDSLTLTLAENSETNVAYAYTNFIRIKASTADPPPAWSIVRVYGLLTAGTVSNQISVVLASANTNATGYLDIENPMVLSYSPTTNGVVAGWVNGLFALQPSTNTLVTFTFGPLMTGQTVTFNLLDQSQKLIAKLGQQVVYPPGSSASQSTTPATASGK